MLDFTPQTMPHTPASLVMAGFEHGSEVMTMDGIRLIETLAEGDRIVTRSGATLLRDVIRTANNGFQLIFDKPEVVFLAHGQFHSDTGLPFSY